MDKTNEYIEMCKKANEMHNHESESGDWYADDCHGLHILSINDFLPSDKRTHSEICEEEYIWLPRQDQLQEMIQGSFKEVMDKENEFANGSYPLYPYMALSHFKSKEQLLLGLIMKEEHNKLWTGINWIINSPSEVEKMLTEMGKDTN